VGLKVPSRLHPLPAFWGFNLRERKGLIVMMRQKVRLLVFLLGLGVLLLGCGGGKGISPSKTSDLITSSTHDYGKVIIAIQWSNRNRFIPPETDRIRVILQRAGVTLMEKTVERPTAQTETTVIFEKVPVGEWTLAAEAYAGLRKVAEGISESFQVQAGQTSTVMLELQPVAGYALAQVVDNGRRIKLVLGIAKECVAVEIYRDTSPSVNATLSNLIDIVDGQATVEYYDSDLAYYGTATIEIDEDTPANRLPPLARSYTAGIGTGEGNVTEEPFKYEKPFSHTPIRPGVHYWFAIRRINARRLSSSQGQGEPFELVYSPPSSPIGPLTPLAQLTEADLIEPTGDVDIRNVTFRFLSAQGADEYIVQVSDNPGFPANRTVQIPLPYKLANPDIGGQVLVIANQDLSGRFGAGQTLYWRVGYRYSRDISPPEGGWVFSRVRSFTVPVTPPPSS
jgi:hypothetical protein